MTGYVHSFESLGTLDGPGLRFVVFFSGCPLRCQYCHNPDTWNMSDGKEMSSDEIVNKALRYRPYFANEGGITLSGGEPLMQPKFALKIMRECKKEGISTCVDTSGSIFNDDVKAALDYTDLIILDVKHTGAEEYSRLTGGNIGTHRTFLNYCIDMQIPLWIRQVILPGWNDTSEDMASLMSCIKDANVRKIELLPYHVLGIHKWEALGVPNQLKNVIPPTEEKMDMLRKFVANYKTYLIK